MQRAPNRPRSIEGGTPPASAPHRVRLPVNLHRWADITFLHWPYPPEEVAALLPDQLSVLTHGGRAWVGVTPFFIHVRLPGIGRTALDRAFPETNVRTYVTGPDGRQGIWFLHMEVTAAWFVAALRAVGLPYVRRRMSVDAQPARITYRSSPRRPGAQGGHAIVVRPGEPLRPPEGGERERFLTARWGAYHRRGPALLYTPVEHGPWPLRSAQVDTCEVGSLFAAAGLSVPAGAPLACFSPGVEVKVGPPRLVC